MTARLDQLRFPDETKLGLALLVGYMMLDASQTFSLGGWHLLLWLTGATPSMWQAGALQLFMVVALSVVLMGWRIRLSLKGLQLRCIEEADAKASRETDYLGSRIAQGRAKFFVTANMGDANAFCMWTGKVSWIVLGGGLRLLFRKDAARARAIVAHECAHVDAGDTQYLLVAWHVFNAYAILTIGGLLLMQVRFWLGAPEVQPALRSGGPGLIDLLEQNFTHVLRNGIPALIVLASLAFVLRHLARLREYRADERAAQAGLRQPLVDILSALVPQMSQPGWRRFFAFHPTTDERAKRLSNESRWGRADLLFIGALAFLGVRISEHFERAGEGPVPATANFEDMMAFLVRSMAADPLAVASTVLSIAILFIAVVNVYRASATQVKLGATLRSRLLVVLPASVALFLGSLAGDLTSWGLLMRPGHASRSWGWIDVVDSAFFSAALATMAGVFLLLGVSLVASRMLRHVRRPGWGQLWKLSWWTLLVALVLQLGANIVGGLVGLAMGGGLGEWDVSWLPRSSMQVVPGFPSLLQTFVGLSLAVVALQAFRLWPGRARQAVPRVDTSWLVKEQGSLAPMPLI